MSMEIPLVNPEPGFYYIHPDAFTEVLDHLHEIVSRARLEYIQAVTDAPYDMTSLTPSLVLELYPVAEGKDLDVARQLVTIMQADPELQINLLREINTLMNPIGISISNITINNGGTQPVDMYEEVQEYPGSYSPEWSGSYYLTLFFCLLQFTAHRHHAHRLNTPPTSIQRLFDREEIIGQMFALIGRTIKTAQLAHVR